MKTNNKVFFGEDGITPSSADYLCSLAKEIIDEDIEELKSASFVEKTVQIIGSNSIPLTASEGKEEDWVNKVNERVHRVMEMHGLINWFKEALAVLKAEETHWDTYTFYNWCTEIAHIRIDTVVQRVGPEPVLIDAEGTFNTEERFKRLSTKTCCDVIGSLISDISNARKELHERMANPVEMTGDGVNLVITNYKATVHAPIVEDLFMTLRAEQRKLNQCMEAYNTKDKEILNDLHDRYQHLVRKATAEYNTELDALHVKYEEFRKAQIENTKKLLIIVPKALQPTVDYLNSLTK